MSPCKGLKYFEGVLFIEVLSFQSVLNGQRQDLEGGPQGLIVSSSPFSVESVFCEGGSVTPPVAEGEGAAV